MVIFDFIFGSKFFSPILMIQSSFLSAERCQIEWTFYHQNYDCVWNESISSKKTFDKIMRCWVYDTFSFLFSIPLVAKSSLYASFFHHKIISFVFCILVVNPKNFAIHWNRKMVESSLENRQIRNYADNGFRLRKTRCFKWMGFVFRYVLFVSIVGKREIFVSKTSTLFPH